MSDQEQQILHLKEIIKQQEEDKVLLKNIWKHAREMNENDDREGEETNAEELLKEL